MKTEGILYIIATPIGNVMDITYRAVDTMKTHIDALYCEDTRITRRLLAAYDISLPTYSLHSHSSQMKIDRVITLLRNGSCIGYTTDCGTPGISDPGSKLVSGAAAAGVAVIPLPGVSAVSAIVSVSGFQSRNILFAGFLSKKPGRRINELTRLAGYDGSIIIYESPHRITKTLAAISRVFTERKMVIGREMTKQFEEYIRTTTGEGITLTDTLTIKGEFCIAIDNTA